MQVQAESTASMQRREISAKVGAGPAPGALVYDLRANSDNSDGFYVDVTRFSGRVLDEAESRAGAAISAYGNHVRAELHEPFRSRGEYCMELLTLGLTLKRYAAAAERTPRWAVGLARGLYSLRRRAGPMKTPIDSLRTAVTRVFLMPGITQKATSGSYSLDNLPRLIGWLQATGEFEQEAARLNNWLDWLKTLPRPEANRWMRMATVLFAWFEREADRELAGYTRGVRGFLEGEYRRRGCREDQLFCGKEPVEYQLSMVAAEVMNRGLRPDFERTQNRVVLVPACMRGQYASECKARTSGVDISCTACDPACAVNRVTRRIRRTGAKVYLVPHSTGFSRWLERWQGKPEVGVIAVACVLNILPGGYEMRARGIASQCVPLDHPGCRKHWSRDGIPTDLNEELLVQIVAMRPSNSPANPLLDPPL